jgi:hypothetical protein
MQLPPRAPYPLAVGPKEKPIPSSPRNCRQALAHSTLPLTVCLCSKRRTLALGAEVPDLTPTSARSSSARPSRASPRGPTTPTVPWGHLHRHDLRPSSLPLPDLRAGALRYSSSLSLVVSLCPRALPWRLISGEHPLPRCPKWAPHLAVSL